MALTPLNYDLVLTGILVDEPTDGLVEETKVYFQTSLFQIYCLREDRRPDSVKVLDSTIQIYRDYTDVPTDIQNLAFGELIYKDSRDFSKGSWHEQTDSVSCYSYPQMNLVRISYSQWIDNPQKRIYNQHTVNNNFYKYTDLDLDLLLAAQSSGLLHFR